VETEVEGRLHLDEDHSPTTDGVADVWLGEWLDMSTEFDRVYLLVQHDGTWESPWVPLASGSLPAGAERAFFSHETAERVVRAALETIARRSGRQGQ